MEYVELEERRRDVMMQRRYLDEQPLEDPDADARRAPREPMLSRCEPRRADGCGCHVAAGHGADDDLDDPWIAV